MKMNLKGEYIKLGQALKATGKVDSGSEAKEIIVEGKVKVNKEVEKRRGRKLYPGDIVEYNGDQIKIEG